MIARGRRFIAPVSFGLGDLVVSLPVIQAALRQGVKTGKETWLVARSPVQEALAERLPRLAGVVAGDALDLGPTDELIDLRDHPLQRDHWWGSPEFEVAYGQMSMNEILARIATDFGITADFSTPLPLEAVPLRGLEGLVLLVADTDGTAKRWPTERWLALARSLHSAGVDSAVVTRGETNHDLVSKGLAEIVASTPGDAVDVLSACRAVIGVDTGLTHIGVQQGTPTVTISRQPAVYYRAWKHTRLVAGSVCDMECQREERAYAEAQRASLDPDAAPRFCPSRSHCLQVIEPRMVMKALEELC